MEVNTFGKLCTKIFARLICLDIFCFVTCAFCFSASGSQLFRMFLQVACVIVLVSFVYPVCHTVGDLDAPLVSTGHRSYNPFKGLYAGLIASSPMILSSIVLLIAKSFNVIENFVTYYKMINAIFFPFLYSIMPVDYSLAELSLSTIIISCSIQIVVPIICFLSYYLGLKRFSFQEKLLYKKKAS